MKELSIEEKAKRYDEAIEKGNQILNTPYTAHWDIMKEVTEHLFPELKESEDERIRKAIRTIILSSDTKQCQIVGVSQSDMLAWLEKQGKNNMGISETTKQKLEDNLNKALEKETPESCNEFLEKQGEQNLANSAKTCKDEQKPAWSEEDEDRLNSCIDAINAVYKWDSMIAWLKSLKDRVQPQPSQEWSEEDEKIRSSIINFIRYELNHKAYIGTAGVDSARQIEWLKSLSPQNTWKPSDEQMLAINTAINVLGKGTINGKYLIKLQEQLKKLK